MCIFVGSRPAKTPPKFNEEIQGEEKNLTFVKKRRNFWRSSERAERGGPGLGVWQRGNPPLPEKKVVR